MQKLFKDYLNEITKEQIVQYYIIENHSVADCLDFFNIKQAMFMSIIKYYEIKKPKSLSAILSKQKKLDVYGDENYNNRQKAKNTCIDKYGVENVFQTDDAIQKSKETKMIRYNDSHYANKEQAINTRINKYGSLEKAYEQQHIKYAATCLERYGVDCASKANEIKEKIKNTQINNRKNMTDEEKQAIAKKISIANKGKAAWNKDKCLGHLSEEKKKEILAKQYITKKQNNSFNSSACEANFYQHLLKNFSKDDIITQYSTDDRYPFNCDFYIKSKDLFIELNLSWTHGGHKFNANDTTDIMKLQHWKSLAIDSEYYKNAIMTWTERDPKKLKIAETNMLNYLVFYTEEEAYAYEF